MFSSLQSTQCRSSRFALSIQALTFKVAYSDELPWPRAADGLGYSLVPIDPNENPNPNSPQNWRSSTEFGGSPGRDDPDPFADLPSKPYNYVWAYILAGVVGAVLLIAVAFVAINRLRKPRARYETIPE